MHCQQEYESYLMQWQEQLEDDGRRHGYWCCPTPGCSGVGFGFDIFPVDPEYCDEFGQPMSPFGGEEPDDGSDADWLDDDEGDTLSPWAGEPIDADALMREDEPEAYPAPDDEGDDLPPADSPEGKAGPSHRRPWTDDDPSW